MNKSLIIITLSICFIWLMMEVSAGPRLRRDVKMGLNATLGKNEYIFSNCTTDPYPFCNHTTMTRDDVDDE